MVILKGNITDNQSFQTIARTVLIIILNSFTKRKGKLKEKNVPKKDPLSHPLRVGNYDLTVEFCYPLSLMKDKKQLFYFRKPKNKIKVIFLKDNCFIIWAKSKLCCWKPLIPDSLWVINHLIIHIWYISSCVATCSR